MSDDKKVLQSAEYYLKYISWSIKSLVDEIQKLNGHMENFLKKKANEVNF